VLFLFLLVWRDRARYYPHPAWQPEQAQTAAEGGADRRSAKNARLPHGLIARSAPLSAAAPLPRGGHEATPAQLRLLLQVVADYTRVSAVQVAGRAGDGRASEPQYPGVSTSPGLFAEEARWS
jgi:hypothetical protein